jgi:hypothetical protein
MSQPDPTFGYDEAADMLTAAAKGVLAYLRREGWQDLPSIAEVRRIVERQLNELSLQSDIEKAKWN